MKQNVSTTLMLGLTSLTICFGLVLTSTKSYADNDSVTDDVEITVPIACTMSGSIASGQEHTASLSPGTYSAASGSDYENGIGTTTLTTFCNDNNGFSVYAIGFTGDTAGNNTLVGTSASNNATISTDTYTPGDTTSSWSMKVDKVTDTTTSYNPANMTIDNSFEAYHAVPSEYTRVAHYQASTGPSTTDTTLGAKLTTTYAAFISQTQPADTYQGQVKYVMVHPYMQDDSNKPTSSLCASNQLVMQNVSQWQSSVASSNEATACDNRDGKTYTVARLADGNLWMTQNLDYDITNNGGNINSTNTDVPANWADGGGLANTRATSDMEWDEYDEDTNPHGGNYNHPESYDPGDIYWNGYTTSDEFEDEAECTAASGTWDGNWCEVEDYIASSGVSHYKLGNYYNWTAAVAMADSSSYETDGENVDQSICPAGWTLPRGYFAEEESFYGLIVGYGWDDDSYEFSGYTMWGSPLYFPLSGVWRGNLNSLRYSVGDTGEFWSSAVDSSDLAYLLYFDSNGEVYPGSYFDRSTGHPVRCIARPSSN